MNRDLILWSFEIVFSNLKTSIKVYQKKKIIKNVNKLESCANFLSVLYSNDKDISKQYLLNYSTMIWLSIH